MFNTYFYHGQLRRYIVAFGSIFNKVDIRRTDTTGAEVQRIRVPLDYGPKERWLTRLVQDPDFLLSTQILVPRMAYEMPTFTYDSSRKLNTLGDLRFASTAQNRLARLYVGVPYKLGFTLSCLVKHQTDGFQIAEQIIPFFTPDFTFAMKTLPELGLVDQVPMSLVDFTAEDNYEGDFEHRRNILWTFKFQMHVFFYGPVRDSKRITEVDLDLYNTPFDADLGDPIDLVTETAELFTTEDGTGHVLSEETPETYLSVGRVARVTAVADPNQEPIPMSQGGDVQATVTLTEYAPPDVKHNVILEDEQV